MNDDEKVCPRCAETIKRAAVVCRYCGHEFEPEVAEALPVEAIHHPHEESGKSLSAALWIGGLFGLIMLMALVSLPSDPKVATEETNALVGNMAEDPVANDVMAIADTALANAVAAIDTPPQAATGWSYTTSQDQLRGSAIYRASIDSQNSAYFDFPYGGGSTLTMTVRKHPSYGTDVIFDISKGQFICHVDDCAGTINFGDGPETIGLIEPEDNSSDTLFASDAEDVIAKLKKAKKVIVELPFYQEGNRQFTFAAAPLTWPPTGAATEDASVGSDE